MSRRQIKSLASSNSSCRGEAPRVFKTVDDIVDDYIKRYRHRAVEELREYSQLSDLNEVVKRAGLAECLNGKRHDHQRRIPAQALKEAARALSAKISQLKACRSFHDLFTVIEQTIHSRKGTPGIKHIGDLAVYDTALRIGSYLGSEPQHVYLHAGTLEGAHALGLDCRQGKIVPTDLRKPFQRLKPREAEDCLCIYKSDFRRLSQRTSR